jgi:hypothetical protein
MIRVISGKVWKEIAALAAKAGSKRAAVAYVYDDKKISFGMGDVLVVDASAAAIRAGQTSAKVLRAAHDRGAEIYSLEGLHAKVFLLGGVAVVGSANVSKSSETLFESAVIADHPAIIGGAIRAIADLIAAGTRLTEAYLRKIGRIKVKRGGFNPRLKKAVRTVTKQPRTWLLGTHDAPYPGDNNRIESVSDEVASNLGVERDDVDWFYWSGKSRFRKLAEKGDQVILIMREGRRDTSGRGVEVYRPAVLEKRFREPDQKFDTFHCVWPPDWAKRALTWSQFKKLAARVGLENIGTHAHREIPRDASEALAALWP